jgi:RIO-like serine/threonine protein kinase
VDQKVVSAPLVRSLLHTVGKFGRLGVTHTDLNPGNTLFSPGDRPTRTVVIDFGECALRREEEDDERWAEVVDENGDVVWMRRRLEQFLGADFVQESCDST